MISFKYLYNAINNNKSGTYNINTTNEIDNEENIIKFLSSHWGESLFFTFPYLGEEASTQGKGKGLTI